MEAEFRDFELPPWYLFMAVWCGIALFDATQTVFVMSAEGMHHYWGRLYFTQAISWVPYMFATPVVLWLGYRFPGNEWKSATTWVAHFAACGVLDLSAAAWVAMWEEWLNPWALTPGPSPFVRLALSKFYNGMLSTIILYGVVLLVGHILATQRRFVVQQAQAAQLNAQLTKAQLNALRRQIEPHFLFNTLNSIAGLVREQHNDAAVTMIARLSDFLRRVVSDSDRQQVALAEELDFTEKYLEIQKARFGDRLVFTLDVPADLRSAQVPSLILQPMVENAIKHGIAKRARGGVINIAAVLSNGTLTLCVYNDGSSLPAGWEQTTSGIGMHNVRRRLENLYGDAFDLKLRNRRGGVEASVSVPYEVLNLGSSEAKNHAMV